MKRILCLLLVFALLGGLTVSVSASPVGFRVDAKAALLLDLNTGQTIYEQDADEVLYPASLTKIMTAILAIERGDLSDVVTASDEALTGLDPDGTTVWLTAGEKMPLEDLLYCMLLASANDACNVVAEYIAGSVSEFVDMMNEKAAELGCTNTHFNNTNGLPDEDHYTSARDLAIITQYAIQNPTFWEICTTTAYTVAATNVFDARMLVTTNSMTTTYKYYYYYDPRIQGVKTGFTDAAGRCLVSACRRQARTLICVTLNDRNDWADHSALYDYGFAGASDYEVPLPEQVCVQVEGGDVQEVRGYIREPPKLTAWYGVPPEYTVTAEIPPFLLAPVERGAEIGALIWRNGPVEIARTPLYAAKSVQVPDDTVQDSWFVRTIQRIRCMFNRLQPV